MNTAWLNGVPRSWSIKPFWAVVSCNDEALPEDTSPERALQYVEISDVRAEHGITNSTEVLFAQAPSRARRVVKQGDVIVSTVRTYLRAIAHVSHQHAGMVVSTGFAVLRPSGVHDRYLAYVLSSEEIIGEVIARSVGVSYPAINASDLLRIKFPVPPALVQQGIAAFLDRETAKIDALVAEQERLLVLLEEKRQAVIANAVTKGLDPNVPMKDSGVEGLGVVPVHWRLTRLKYVAGGVTVGVVVKPTQYYAASGVIALRSLNVRPMGINIDDVVYFDPLLESDLGKSRLSEGDVVVVRTGKPGTAAVIGGEHEGINCIDLIIIRKSAAVDATFLALTLNSEACRVQYARGAEGALQQHFNIETADNLVVAVPSRYEQQVIVARLAQDLGKIDQLDVEAHRNLALMRERRDALISAAITGKLDVQALAPATEPALAAE